MQTPEITINSIVFQDEFLIAVNKPEGLLVHPSFIDKHEKECAMKQLRDLIGKWVYPVHRLDRPTSGILVFGLNSDSAASLSDIFAQRMVKKTYLALVRGFTEPSGTIERPLKEIWDKMTDRNASKDKPAQEAVTHYQTLSQAELQIPMPPHPTSRYSLLKVTPETGRQRQIRRHFKSIFHPLIGDPKHGDGAHNRMFKEQFGLNRLMLHATSLEFVHPFTGEHLDLRAEPPPSFTSILEKTGLLVPHANVLV